MVHAYMWPGLKNSVWYTLDVRDHSGFTSLLGSYASWPTVGSSPETVCNSLLTWESKTKVVFNLDNSSSLWKTWAKSLNCGCTFLIYCRLQRGANKRAPWQGSSLIKLSILFSLNLLLWTRWILSPIIFKML